MLELTPHCSCFELLKRGCFTANTYQSVEVNLSINKLERIYETPAYAASSGRESFWSETAESSSGDSLQVDRRTDVVVIGAGYAGLNASL